MNLKQKSQQYPSTGGIYKITNPNGQIYIGQAVNFQQRYYYYLTAPFKDQPRIKESFNKFGSIEKHTFEVVEECDENLLDERELFWGNHFDVLGENGLNCRLGHGKGRLRDSTKNLISVALTSKKQSKETIEKRRTKLQGQKRNQETCDLMREKKIGYEITWGDKIKESNQEHYQSGSDRNKKISENTLDKKGIPIIQKNKNGEYIQEFLSTAQAERITGVKRDNICMVLKGRTKTAGGFIWEYK